MEAVRRLPPPGCRLALSAVGVALVFSVPHSWQSSVVNLAQWPGQNLSLSRSSKSVATANPRADQRSGLKPKLTLISIDCYLNPKCSCILDQIGGSDCQLNCQQQVREIPAVIWAIDLHQDKQKQPIECVEMVIECVAWRETDIRWIVNGFAVNECSPTSRHPSRPSRKNNRWD